MIVFPAALQGVTCAAAIQDELATHNADAGAGPIPEKGTGPGTGPISEPIKVRMGLHMGEAIAEEGDFFGKSVILASRIAESAGGDQILVSSEIVDALKSETAFTFASAGAARLSGLSDEYELFEVGPSSGPGATPGPGQPA
jgi:adenylate cyclase